MVHDSKPRGELVGRRPERCLWLALAVGGPVAAIAASVDERRLRVVADTASFSAGLREGHPRVAILADPPAGAEALADAVDERRRRHTLRILHISASADLDARLDAIRAGVDDAVTDRIDPRELLGRIELLSAASQAPTRHELPVADDVVLDLVAHELRRHGRVVHLRPKEFQLLALLAAHPGRAYSRRQILDRVWGHDHDGDPRTVDVHVRWLRAKVEPEPEGPVHLVTVRGVGYRLDPIQR
jgi:two-component system alkaline phosphatase synthesis response regulator PhoP